MKNKELSERRRGGTSKDYSPWIEQRHVKRKKNTEKNWVCVVTYRDQMDLNHIFRCTHLCQQSKFSIVKT